MPPLPLLLQSRGGHHSYQLLRQVFTSSPSSPSSPFLFLLLLFLFLLILILIILIPSLTYYISIPHVALHSTSTLVFMEGQMPSLLPHLHSLCLQLSQSPRCSPLHSHSPSTFSHSLSGWCPRVHSTTLTSHISSLSSHHSSSSLLSPSRP